MRKLPMRRIAVRMLLSAVIVMCPLALWGQITAQPARTVNAFQPNSSGSAFTPYSAPAMLSSLTTSPEANSVRGWYRDYLGRDVGPDVSALVNLMRGGMSPTDLQATILGSEEFYSQKGRDPQ